MQTPRWSPFVQEGRIAGSFVYLLLCRDENKIYIKVGNSIQPEQRFLTLRNGCPVTPRTLSVIHLPSRKLAQRLELSLHGAFSQWRVAGEWFSMVADDKQAFNEKLHTTLKAHSMPQWKLAIQKVPANTLVRMAQQRKDFWRHRYKRNGSAYRDFLKHSR